MKSSLLVGLIAATLLLLAATAVRADTLYGTIVYEDGSRAGSEISVSTSWNSKKGYPAIGRYTLDFGGRVNHAVTVYVRGKAIGRVNVSGNTRLDIVVP